MPLTPKPRPNSHAHAEQRCNRPRTLITATTLQRHGDGQDNRHRQAEHRQLLWARDLALGKRFQGPDTSLCALKMRTNERRKHSV